MQPLPEWSGGVECKELQPSSSRAGYDRALANHEAREIDSRGGAGIVVADDLGSERGDVDPSLMGVVKRGGVEDKRRNPPSLLSSPSHI